MDQDQLREKWKDRSLKTTSVLETSLWHTNAIQKCSVIASLWFGEELLSNSGWWIQNWRAAWQSAASWHQMWARASELCQLQTGDPRSWNRAKWNFKKSVNWVQSPFEFSKMGCNRRNVIYALTWTHLTPTKVKKGHKYPLGFQVISSLVLCLTGKGFGRSVEYPEFCVCVHVCGVCVCVCLCLFVYLLTCVNQHFSHKLRIHQCSIVLVATQGVKGCQQWMEPWKHKMVWVGRDLWSSSRTLPPEQVAPRRGTRAELGHKHNFWFYFTVLSCGSVLEESLLSHQIYIHL